MSETGRVFDLPSYVDRLMRASDSYAFLVVTIAGTDDFIQLSGGPTGVQLDFPLVSSRQCSLETRIREAAASARLPLVENTGSNGARFLDLYLDGDAQSLAASCSQMLRQVFNVSGDSQLIFEHDGLAVDDYA